MEASILGLTYERATLARTKFDRPRKINQSRIGESEIISRV
jgi:hypothetical protein